LFRKSPIADQPLQIDSRFIAWRHDDVRSRIMPINRKYNLSALLDACRYSLHGRAADHIEFILIAQVNDSDEQARQLLNMPRLRGKS